ncbi:MAG: hypothetical protein ABEI06_08630, partial [Halobacteriaceae archaeon]
MTLSFEAVSDPGVEIFDDIERQWTNLHTDSPVSIESANTESFFAPVDKAIRIQTASITLPNVVATFIRDSEGNMIDEVNHFASVNLDKGKYTLEFATAIKTYIQVESAITLESDDEIMNIDFGSSTDVVIGSRSRHEHPEATITTTEDPADIMEAV